MGGDSGSLFGDLEPSSSAPEEGTEPAALGEGELVEVALRIPRASRYHYRVPEELKDAVRVGLRCRVPFGRRSMVGFVVALPAETDVPLARLRSITALIDQAPVFDSDMLKLCRWMARYYGASLGDVLEVAMPRAVMRVFKKRAGLPASQLLALATPSPSGRPGPAVQKLLRVLGSATAGMTISALLERSGVTRPTLRRAIERGWLSMVEGAPLRVARDEGPAPVLSAAQEAAVESIVSELEARRFSTKLLFGVTGSGKTEVYLRAIERCLALGRGAIVLVPEIALTPQTTRRFRSRFGDAVAVLHSRLSDRNRADAWQRVKGGDARVVIGPRSALFAPVPQLGLIVVDEEHESSYKQERAPRYHARDVAVMRARDHDAVIVLGSATPSLESFQNALSGRYGLLRLDERVGGGSLPKVEVVDMGVEWREVRGAPLISRLLKAVVSGSLERGERAILFLNRRGFTTFLHCRGCGYVHKCPSCDISLTYHKRSGVLLCHFCSEEAPVPHGPCPECQGAPLRHSGAGTERIEEAVQEAFPRARFERVDSDTVRSVDDVEAKLERFRAGDVDVLIGTQMIARGLDIAEVTAVGVLNADISLGHPDFRATERTFQLVAQVAGRAGRGARPGRTVIQTFKPDESSILAAAHHDFEGYATGELRVRESLGYPPFGRLLHLLVRGPDRDLVESEAQRLVHELKGALPAGCRILGPAASPRAYLANRFRFQALLKAPSPGAVQQVMERAAAFKPERSAVEVVLDRDPSFML